MERESESPDAAVKSRKKGIFYGWKVLAAGSAITTIGSIHSPVVSVFFLPLQRELELSRAALSFVFSLARIEGGIEGPLVGWMIDKQGPRIPVIIGTLLSGFGMLALSQVNSTLGFLLVYTGLVALGFQMGYLQVMHAAANIWFIRYRTRAMSIFSSSVRLGPAVFTPILGVIVDLWDWRTGAILTGFFVLITALPLTYFIKRSPESMGLLPDGADPEELELPPDGANTEEPDSGNSVASERKETPRLRMPEDFEFKEAMRTPVWWILALTTTVRTSNNGVFQVHFIPIFVWKDVTETGAAVMVGLTQLIATPMILGVGWLGDRWSKKAILVLAHFVLGSSFLVLIFVDQRWGLYLFMVMFAFGANVAPANYSIIGDYFGRKSFARLRGVLNSLGIIGMGTTVLAGWVFDATGSYAAFIFGTAVFSAIAGITVIFFLHKPSRPGARSASAT